MGGPRIVVSRDRPFLVKCFIKGQLAGGVQDIVDRAESKCDGSKSVGT